MEHDMTAKSYLKTNETLRAGEYLVSASGLFFAVQQRDGNFCVYHGSGPGDDQGFLFGTVQDGGAGPFEDGEFFTIMQADGNLCVYRGTGRGDNQGFVFGIQDKNTGVPFPKGDFFAVMQDDGNLCVYHGTGPDDNRGYVWGTGTARKVTRATFSNFVYEDGSHMQEEPRLAAVYRQTLRNETPVEQTHTVSLSCTYSESRSWEVSAGLEVGVETTISGGVPFEMEGSVTVSAKVTVNARYGETHTEEKTFAEQVPVVAPANSTVACQAYVSTVAVAIPYVADAVLTYDDGRTVRGKVRGTYNGVQAYDMQVHWGVVKTMQVRTADRREAVQVPAIFAEPATA
jgi:hypothetical protein